MLKLILFLFLSLGSSITEIDASECPFSVILTQPISGMNSTFSDLINYSSAPCNLPDLDSFKSDKKSSCDCLAKEKQFSMTSKEDLKTLELRAEEHREWGVTNILKNNIYRIIDDTVKFDLLNRDGYFQTKRELNKANARIKNCRMNNFFSLIKKRKRNLNVIKSEDCDITPKEFDKRLALLIQLNPNKKTNLDEFEKNLKKEASSFSQNKIQDPSTQCLPRKTYLGFTMTPGGMSSILKGLKKGTSLKLQRESLLREVTLHGQRDERGVKTQAQIKLDSFNHTLKFEPLLSKASTDEGFESKLIKKLKVIKNKYDYRHDLDLIQGSLTSLGNECNAFLGEDGFILSGFLCKKKLPEVNPEEVFNGLYYGLGGYRSFDFPVVAHNLLCSGENEIAQNGFESSGTKNKQVKDPYNAKENLTKINFNTFNNGIYKPSTDFLKDSKSLPGPPSSYQTFNNMFCEPFLKKDKKFDIDIAIGSYLNENPKILKLFKKKEKELGLKIKITKNEKGEIVGVDLENSRPACDKELKNEAECDPKRIPHLSYEKFMTHIGAGLGDDGLETEQINTLYKALESITNGRFTALEKEFKLAQKVIPEKVKGMSLNDYYIKTKNGDEILLDLENKATPSQKKVLMASRSSHKDTETEEADRSSLFSDFALHGSDEDSERLREYEDNDNSNNNEGDDSDLIYARSFKPKEAVKPLGTLGFQPKINPEPSTTSRVSDRGVQPRRYGEEEEPRLDTSDQDRSNSQQQVPLGNQASFISSFNQNRPKTTQKKKDTKKKAQAYEDSSATFTNNQNPDDLDKLLAQAEARGAKRGRSETAKKYGKVVDQLSKQTAGANKKLKELFEKVENDSYSGESFSPSGNNSSQSIASYQGQRQASYSPPVSRGRSYQSPTPIDQFAQRINQRQTSKAGGKRASRRRSRTKRSPANISGSKSARKGAASSSLAKGLPGVEDKGALKESSKLAQSKGIYESEKKSAKVEKELLNTDSLSRYEGKNIIDSRDFEDIFHAKIHRLVLYLKLIGEPVYILHKESRIGDGFYVLTEYRFRYMNKEGKFDYFVDDRKINRIQNFSFDLYEKKKSNLLLGFAVKTSPYQVQEQCERGSGDYGDLKIGECLSNSDIQALKELRISRDEVMERYELTSEELNEGQD